MHITRCYLFSRLCEHRPVSQNKPAEANLVTSLQSACISQQFNKLMSFLPSSLPFFSISSPVVFCFVF